MTVTDIWFDLYWSDLTECARARVFANLLSAGIQIPDSVLESRQPLYEMMISEGDYDSN